MDVGKRLDLDGPAANGKEKLPMRAKARNEERSALKTPDR
jgi:hypothetical protein